MKSLRIERLQLDLRGIDPRTAEAAARLLGPALAQALQSALASPRQPLASARLDAGGLQVAAGLDAPALAARMAAQITQAVQAAQTAAQAPAAQRSR